MYDIIHNRQPARTSAQNEEHELVQIPCWDGPRGCPDLHHLPNHGFLTPEVRPRHPRSGGRVAPAPLRHLGKVGGVLGGGNLRVIPSMPEGSTLWGRSDRSLALSNHGGDLHRRHLFEEVLARSRHLSGV